MSICNLCFESHVFLKVKSYTALKIDIYQGKKETQQVQLFNFQKQSQETISFELVQRHVNCCCTAHLFQRGIKTVFQENWPLTK